MRKILVGLFLLVGMLAQSASAQWGEEEAAFGGGWGGWDRPQLFERSGGQSFEWRQRQWSTPQFSGWGGGGGGWGSRDWGGGGGGWQRPQIIIAPRFTNVSPFRDREWERQCLLARLLFRRRAGFEAGFRAAEFGGFGGAGFGASAGAFAGGDCPGGFCFR